MRVGGQRHAAPVLPPGEKNGNNCTGGWMGPRGRVYRYGNLPSIGIRFPYRPVPSQSLNQLSYPGPGFYSVVSLSLLVFFKLDFSYLFTFIVM